MYKILIILLLAASVAMGVTFTQAKSGDWTEPSTWDKNSSYPQINDTAKLVGGYTVAVGDSNTCRALVTLNTSISSWAQITGAGALRVIRQYVVSYLSDQRTKALYCDAASAGKTKVYRCTYTGLSKVTFGSAGFGLATDTCWIKRCDFAHLTLIDGFLVTGLAGDASGYSVIDSCVFDQRGATDTVLNIRINNRHKTAIKNCVLANAGYSCLISTATATPVYFENIIVRWKSTNGANIDPIKILPVSQSTHFVNSYIHSDKNNGHPISFQSCKAGTVDTIAGCVFEVYLNGSSSTNTVSVGPGAVIGYNNIQVGEGVMFNNVGARTGDSVILKNNTLIATSNVDDADPKFWISESGAFSGLLKWASNLIATAAGVTVGKGGGGVNAVTQTITWSSRNIWSTSVTNKYWNYTLTEDSSAHELVHGTAPIKRTDMTLAGYSTLKGGIGTTAAAIDSFTRINGYNSITKLQDAAPTAFKHRELMAYFRNGAQPTAGFGEGLYGVDVGAVPHTLTHKDTLTGTGDTLLIRDSVSASLFITDFKKVTQNSVFVVLDTARSGSTSFAPYDTVGPIKGGNLDTVKLVKINGTLKYRTRFVGTEILGDSLFTDTLAVDSVTYSSGKTKATITVQPENSAVNEGANATFSITATGSNLRYVCYRNGDSTGNTNSKTFATTYAMNGALIRFKVWADTADTVWSNTVTLTVLPTAPDITVQPISDTATGPVRMFAEWTGTAVNIAWYRLHGTDTTLLSRDSVLQFNAPPAMDGDSVIGVLWNITDTVATGKAYIEVVWLVFDSVSTSDSLTAYFHGNALSGSGWTATIGGVALTTGSGSATAQSFVSETKLNVKKKQYKITITNGAYTLIKTFGKGSSVVTTGSGRTSASTGVSPF